MTMGGEMKSRTIVSVVVLLVALLAVVLWRLLPDAEKPTDKSAATMEKRIAKARGERTVRRQAGRPGPALPDKSADDEAMDDQGKPGSAPDPEKTEEEMLADQEEALVDAFDEMTDKWRDPVESDVPMAEVEKFRQQFNKIPQARREECLQRALNLLPDENIMLLAGILLDKEQPREYLELVFNDVLNRDEGVKKPLLLEIYKDKEHPCWADTAWILDATGATDGK
jgi:hypothetical protein